MKTFLKEISEHIYQDKRLCIHSYERVKKAGKFGKMLEEFVDRWGRFGFLEGFPDERKEELAYAYEQFAAYLLLCEDDQTDRLFKDGEFETIGFPMIRRVMTSIDPNVFDFQKFLQYCKLFNVNNILDLVNRINPLTNDDPSRPWKRKVDIDSEAEAVATVCAMVIEKFKNPNGSDRVIRRKHARELYDRFLKHLARRNEDEY